MENMKDLEESIYRLALGHSYMGERIPKSCLIIEQVIEEMKEKKAREKRYSYCKC